MRTCLNHLQAFLCLGLSLVFLSAAPSLLLDKNGLNISLSRYMVSVWEALRNLLNPHTLTIYSHSQTVAFEKMPVNLSVVFLEQATERPLFPEIWGLVFYTLGLLFASFIVAFVLAVIFGWMTELLPSALKKTVIQISDLLEALPDLFFVFSIQLCVVWIYKQTGWLAANPFTSSKDPSFLLPVITLSLVPAIYLFRLQLVLAKQEFGKEYVLFARAKGFPKPYIVFHHVLKNTVREMAIHFPFIMLLLLSQLVVLEYLFNMHGLMTFLISAQPVETRAMLLILIAVPLFFTARGIQKFFPGREGY